MHFCDFSKDEINLTIYKSLHNLGKGTRSGTDTSPSLCVHYVHIVQIDLGNDCQYLAASNTLEQVYLQQITEEIMRR